MRRVVGNAVEAVVNWLRISWMVVAWSVKRACLPWVAIRRKKRLCRR
jgi:hypothetical protein